MLNSEEFGKLRIRDFYGTDVVEMLHIGSHSMLPVLSCVIGAIIYLILAVRKLNIG